MAKLRCRPGDIAILRVKGNEVKLVRVIQRSPGWVDAHYGAPAWVIETLGAPLNVLDLDSCRPAGMAMRTNTPDRCLTPLRDDPGVDQTLTGAKAPHEFSKEANNG